MSYRPTISVYIDGHIADIGYYRNWDETDLFFEAVAIAALFGKCKSVQEYKEKKFGQPKVYYSIEPESFENTEENLKFFESHSEFPILMDLTSKCIYISEGAKEKDELLSLCSALGNHANYGYRKAYRWTGETKIVLDEYTLPAYEEYMEEIPAVDKISVRNVAHVMDYCRIPFDHVDMTEVLGLFLKHNELRRHLSTSTIELLDKEKRICA